MTTILFQGDSITDMNCRQLLGMPPFQPVPEPPMPGYGDILRNNVVGTGYPDMVSGELTLKNPGKYKFINRGMSGARITDAYCNIKVDVINLKPDVISMLFGVNGVAHDITMQNGISAEKFERVYRQYIAEIKEALPQVKIMLMEPYVLNGYLTKDHWDEFFTETGKRSAAVKSIAEDLHLPLVLLQEKMSEYADQYGSELLTMDGIHPTSAGSVFIAEKWIDQFSHMMHE